MNDILDFLRALAQNNNRTWFNEHRDWYTRAQNRFYEYAQATIDGIASFDASVANLTIKDTTYRIYKDMRFHKGEPYKTHFGVYVCPGGKKSGFAGYYLHIDPSVNDFALYAGLYNPTPTIARIFRQSVKTHGADIEAALAECPTFELPWDAAYKRFPKGFSDDCPYSHLYRLRSYEIRHTLQLSDVLENDLIPTAVNLFKQTYRYNQLLNQCVSHAHVLALTGN